MCNIKYDYFSCFQHGLSGAHGTRHAPPVVEASGLEVGIVLLLLVPALVVTLREWPASIHHVDSFLK